MILSLLLVLLNVTWQEPEVPLKPTDEFQLTVDYRFKTMGATSSHSNLNIDYANDRILKEGGAGPMPYLVIKFKMLKLAEQEVRAKVINNAPKIVLSKKVKEGEDFD